MAHVISLPTSYLHYRRLILSGFHDFSKQDLSFISYHSFKTPFKNLYWLLSQCRQGFTGISVLAKTWNHPRYVVKCPRCVVIPSAICRETILNMSLRSVLDMTCLWKTRYPRYDVSESRGRNYAKPESNTGKVVALSSIWRAPIVDLFFLNILIYKDLNGWECPRYVVKGTLYMPKVIIGRPSFVCEWNLVGLLLWPRVLCAIFRAVLRNVQIFEALIGLKCLRYVVRLWQSLIA